MLILLIEKVLAYEAETKKLRKEKIIPLDFL